MDIKEKASGFFQRLKRIVKRVLIVGIIIGIVVISYLFFGVYSRGERAGRVVKVSEKGLIFKTYEGQINLESFGAVPGENKLSETFEFSVSSSSPDALSNLRQALSEGKRVNIEYVEHYWKLPWRGDTKYFVRSVNIIGDNGPRPNQFLRD